MPYVYVLSSLKNAKRYVGFSLKDPRFKLKEHNSRATQWTRQNGPFELIYQEHYEDMKFSRKREKFLKSGNGRAFLDRVIPS